MNWKFWKKNKPVAEERGYFADALTFASGSSYQMNKSMQLATVYRCVECISDSLAQLPLLTYRVDSDGHKEVYSQHPVFNVLNSEPNRKMTRFTFIKLVVNSLYLKGDAFAYIDRDEKGNAKQIIFLPAEHVTVLDFPDRIRYHFPGIDEIDSEDMLHWLNYTEDGVHGISTVRYAAGTLGLSQDEEDNARGFFKGGSNLAGVLTVESSLTSRQKSDIKTSWMQAFNGTSGNPNGIAVLEGNMKYQPITVNPADAELLASRQYSVVEICRFFGVSPVKAFDLSKSSYSTVEATQLAFLTDTLAPLMVKIESEFQRKLFKPSEKHNVEVHFDQTQLLSADLTSKANYYNTLYQIGCITPNEIRKQLNLSHLEDGDKAMTPLNMAPMNQIKPETENEDI